MNILVTGAAGFIGMHVAICLLRRGDHVFGLDNLNDYYDPVLKIARLDELAAYEHFQFEKLDIADADAMDALFERESFDRVIHLAAHAGVRNSIRHPRQYVDANITGTLNILEGCRHQRVDHLVYASTSSVYGLTTDMPFTAGHQVDHPTAIYGASKRAAELMAHSYSHLFNLPTTGLRFFTVYGPWGRPDMALFLFTQKILNGEAIPVFNHGHHRRDFTYIDDIAQGVVRCVDRAATPDAYWDSANPTGASSSAPYRLYNIGHGEPVLLMDYIRELEHCLGMTAKKQYLPMQPGDIEASHADVGGLEEAVGYRPKTAVSEGVRNFVDWYRSYYGLSASDIAS